MREIKFRAWLDQGKWTDEPEVRMLSFEELTSRYEGKMGDLFSDEDVTLMQYTGLKDRNGVEIYEGDICETPEGRFEVRYGEWENDWSYGEYEPSKAIGFHFVVKPNTGDTALSSDLSEEIEVVGNIYENP